MVQFFTKKDGSKIAYCKTVPLTPKAPGIVFLGGFRSDMTGTKAMYLEELSRKWGSTYVRFDYFAHGASSGEFADGTIGRWLDDALVVLDELTKGPQILVGSSMGGWLMLLVTLQRLQRIQGLVGIAAAPDFLEDFERLSVEQHQDLARDGICYIPSQYGDPYPITQKLIEEGRQYGLLQAPIPIHCPVRLLHGLLDTDVPWQKSLTLAERLLSNDITVTLVKDSDHRLSSEANLHLLRKTLEGLL